MWQKILVNIALRVIANVDWDELLGKLLDRLADLIERRTGSVVDFGAIDRGEVLAVIEEVLADHLHVNLDLNADGKIGDGVDGCGDPTL